MHTIKPLLLQSPFVTVLDGWKRALSVCTLGVLFLGLCPVYGAEPVPVTIDGPPVAPPILDRDGDGLCMSSKQAQVAKTPRGNYDAGNIFGSEVTAPPNKCFESNRTEKGIWLPEFVNKFMDGEYFPAGVGGATRNAKVSLLNLSNCPSCPGTSQAGRDWNGDFFAGRSYDVEGDPFPGIPLPNFLPGSAIATRYTVNDAAQTKRTYPEAKDTDQIRDTSARIRGYLNVKPEWVGKTIVFGVYADDGLAFSIYDKNKNQRVIISVSGNRCEACAKEGDLCRTATDAGTRLSCSAANNFFCQPCRPGQPCTAAQCLTEHCQANLICDPAKTGNRWRVTNSVRFYQAGLYPIEMIYIQFAGNAALEVSYRILEAGTPWTNIYENWGYPPDNMTDPGDTYFNATSAPLSFQGFQILDPALLFQTTNGDSLNCTDGECNRNNPNCGGGRFCNPAGICEPCSTKDMCGDTCQPCKGTEQCVKNGNKYECVQCTKNADCAGGQSCVQGACVCQEDTECPRGQVCNNQTCVPCGTKNQCEGNSCGCCSGNTHCSGKVDPKDPNHFECVECVDDSECAAGFTCDTNNHKCVLIGKLPACRTNDRCGAGCSPCPAARPFCADGEVCVACRSDLDCKDGAYCLSGVCADCTIDRKCGSQCRTCTPDKPFCDSQGTSATAQCVECTKNTDCGTKGQCDLTSHTCLNACTVTCPTGQHCLGDQCVECVSSAQCGCGASCDLATHQCSPGCQDSRDCLANECCSPDSKQCEVGLCAALVTLNGLGVFACTIDTPAAHPTPPPLLLLGLGLICIGLLGLAGWRRWALYKIHTKRTSTHASSL